MNEQTETRNYNEDEFDWDDDEAVAEDQAHISAIEALIQPVPDIPSSRGQAWLKPSAVSEDRARKAYNVPFKVTDEQRAHLIEEVGGLRTLTFNGDRTHDHPVSHTLTNLNEELMHDMLGDAKCVDVFGNHSRNMAMGRGNVLTTRKDAVAHDAFRAQGTREHTMDHDVFMQRREYEKYTRFACTHALYYLSLEEISTMLGSGLDGQFVAAIHRHPESNGYLNNKEVKYSVDPDGNVTQTNVSTGFRYTHPSLEALFHQDSVQTHAGTRGLTWDIKKGLGDTYLVKFITCRAGLASPAMQKTSDLIARDREVRGLNGAVVTSVWGWRWYSFVKDGTAGPILQDNALFDRLRRTIAGKERTPRTKADLMSMCRRLANKNDIIAVHSGFTHEVPPEQMTDYVQAAYYADVLHEVEVAFAYHKENKDAVEVLNRYLTEQKMPTDFSALAKMSKRASDAAKGAVANGLLFVPNALHAAAYGEETRLDRTVKFLEGGSATNRFGQDPKELVETLNLEARCFAFSKSKLW